MIVHHQNGVAALSGNHVYYWVGQPFLKEIVTVTSAAPSFIVAWAAQSTVVIQPGMQA